MVSRNAQQADPPVKARVLYITYDGLLEPLGQSQVLQYLRKLAHRHQLVLVSYEKPQDLADRARLKAAAADVRGAGIRWVPLRYHKTPSVPATAYDVARGLLLCAYLTLRHRIRIVHARGYVPALLALLLARAFGTRFIFDMRGFWADEKVVAGSWRQGSVLYRTTRWFERRFLTRADVVVSLTHAAVSAMREFPYLRDRPPRFAVIPTCTDLEAFRPRSNGVEDRATRPFTLGYLGSVGTRYMFDVVLECFTILRGLRPDGRLRILTRGDHADIRERVRVSRIPERAVEIKAVEYPRVAEELQGIDAGIFFYQPAFSMMATAPTKLGEFLACGIPCLANAGVGDVEEALEGSSVGVVLRELTVSGKEQAVRRLVDLAASPTIRQRCVEVARHRFSLETGVQGYDKIYRSLSDRGLR